MVREVQDRIKKLILQEMSVRPLSSTDKLLLNKSTCCLHPENAVTVLKNLNLKSYKSEILLLTKYVHLFSMSKRSRGATCSLS